MPIIPPGTALPTSTTTTSSTTQEVDSTMLTNDATTETTTITMPPANIPIFAGVLGATLAGAIAIISMVVGLLLYHRHRSTRNYTVTTTADLSMSMSEFNATGGNNYMSKDSDLEVDTEEKLIDTCRDVPIMNVL